MQDAVANRFRRFRIENRHLRTRTDRRDVDVPIDASQLPVHTDFRADQCRPGKADEYGGRRRARSTSKRRIALLDHMDLVEANAELAASTIRLRNVS